MFEVGKKVICIKDHTDGHIKRGDVFELIGIGKGVCEHTALTLDIGHTSSKAQRNGHRCIYCGKVGLVQAIRWYNATIFAPYDDSLSEVTADELIESLELEPA